MHMMFPLFSVPPFPPRKFGPVFSSPVFSTPAIWFHVFQSCVFQSRVFSLPLFLYHFYAVVTQPLKYFLTRLVVKLVVSDLRFLAGLIDRS